MTEATIFFQMLTGLAKGASLFLLASGLSLIFGVLDVVNFAHATFYLMGAYTCFTIVTLLPEGGYWLALFLAPLVVAVAGAFVERFIFRHVYTRPHATHILLAWGIILVLGDLFKIIWGTAQRTVPVPEILAGGVSVFGGTFPNTYIFAMGFSFFIAAVLFVVIYRTRAGRLIRATSADAEMTNALGIAVDKLYTIVFATACWLAGVGGVIAALLTPVYLGSDLEIILSAFIIVIVGGMGSILGSLVGSVIYGVIFALGILVLPRYSIVFIYVLMIVVLLFRPYGIFGKPLRR